MKSIMETFDKYFDEHQNFIRDGNCHLIFNLSTIPPIMDDASRWIDHLLDEDILQKEGGEPLLDVTKVSKETYAESLVKLATHNRNNDYDNIDINILDDVGRDNLISTINDREWQSKPH